jgi:hypothetical protein
VEPSKTPEHQQKAEPPKVEPPKKVEPQQPRGEPKPKQEAQPKKEGQSEKKPYKPCFLAGTMVRRSGGEVAIERVAVGDRVLGVPLPALDAGYYAVTGLHRGTTRSALGISIDGFRVMCTAGHRFSVPGTGWVRADELTPGQRVQTELGREVTVSGVQRVQLGEYTTTYDLSVGDVENYFVKVGGHWVLVHNGGDDDQYNRTLYWHFDRNPKLDSRDTDGLSVWKTTSRDDVNTLMAHRHEVDKRDPRKEQYLCMTPEQLDRAGYDCPKTPSDNALAKKLDHHSIRPKDAEKYPAKLDEAQRNELQGRLQGEKQNWEKVKMKDVTGC